MIARILLVLLAAAPLFGRTLHWRSVDVNARLDADGNLHVVERQRMVFDGDWNGGERDFGLRRGQHVAVNRIVRVDGSGREIALEQGPLDAVDRWDYAGSGVVRWRSRLPDDPPFANRELTYVLDYVYRGAVIADGDRFRIAHDFGMPNREGAIEVFRLKVEFDPVWHMRRVEDMRMPLEPGRSVVVDAPLVRTGAGWPDAVVRPLPWWLGPLAVLFFAAGAALLIRAFVRAERAYGRFDPLPERFDPDLLQLRPELAGAVWDAGIGAPEVAALLARMAQEGKIETRVEGDVMHLKLKRLDDAGGYEAVLAQKLFVVSNDTDTTRIREHYKSTGFDPAAIVRPGIESALAEAIPRWRESVRRFNPWIHLATFPAAILFIVVALFFSEEPGPLLLAVFPGAVFAVIACVVAWFASRAITDFARAFVAPAILMAIPMLGFAAGALAARNAMTGMLLPFAIAAWLLALLHLVLNVLRIRDPREVIAFRKRVAGARRFFMRELQQPQPALRDDWFPYILAFGLGPHVDQWFRAFGAASSSSSMSSWSSTSSSSSSSSSASSASSWTGGGGAFGGAGATASWAVAAGAMAAGVAAPGSSGSGGGGGGGGSSSGGGGGGGW